MTDRSGAVRRLVMPFVVVLTLASCAGPERISRPFEYQGYSSPDWTDTVRSSHFIPMEDGTLIAIDVFLPDGYTGGGAPPSSFPVVFQYTPYHRSFLDEKSGAVVIGPQLQFFASHGYAIASADFRGTGSSYGWMNHMSLRIRKDAKQIIDWMAAQPWCDGNVGMAGGSYVGWSQLAAASVRPEALKAIVPNVTGWDGFIMRPGGIMSDAFLQMWSAMQYYNNRNQPFPEFPFPPAPPVVDEDGDGELLDEIPVDANGNGWFQDDYAWPVDPADPPVYPDGVARRHHHVFNAVSEHVADPDGAPGTYDIYPEASELRFWDDARPGDGLTAPDMNFGFIPDVAESGVAIYNLAGWFDAFTRASFEVFATLRRSNPSRIRVRPAYHQGISAAAAAGMGADPEVDANYFSEPYLLEELRFYDRWLKGIDNGIDTEPPVLIFVVNRGWRQEEEWPLARERRTRFFLAEGRRLGATAAHESGFDEYRADLSHGSGFPPALATASIAATNRLRGRPAPTVDRYLKNRQFMFGVPDDLPFRTELDRQVLTYTTEPLSGDTEVTGHPIVHVWASSTADDGDVFFFLEDVDRQGRAVLVTEYGHRAGFATLHDNDEMIPRNPGIDVLPDLPWHGYRRADYTDRVFAGGAVVEVVTDLYPTSWLFREGHRIRLSIAASDWPAFRLHPALAPTNDPAAPDTIVPTISVHRGGDRASYVELPVIPDGGR